MGQIQRANLVVNLNNDKTRHLKKNSNNKSKIEWVWEKALFAISTEYLHRQIPRVEDHSYFSFEKNCLRCKLKKKVSNREWDRDKITTYTSSATYWCGVHSLKHKYSNTHGGPPMKIEHRAALDQWWCKETMEYFYKILRRCSVNGESWPTKFFFKDCRKPFLQLINRNRHTVHTPGQVNKSTGKHLF